MIEAGITSSSSLPRVFPKRRHLSWISIVLCVGLVGCFFASRRQQIRLSSDDNSSRNTGTISGKLLVEIDSPGNGKMKLREIALDEIMEPRQKYEGQVAIATTAAPTVTPTSTRTRTPETPLLAKLQSLESIALHPNSPMANDIVSIQHDAAQSQILINLRSNATCHNPFVVGRLSGPSLIMVDWHYPQKNSNVLVGTYQAAVIGTYHIELLEIMCHNFLFKQNQMLNMDYDFSKECVQNIMQHRLTSDDAIIKVPETSLNQSIEVYWKGLPDAFRHPTFTRVQPHDCSRADESKRCNGNLEWKKFYEFQYTAPIQQLQSTNMRICLIGNSHSRLMTASLKIFIERNELFNNLQVTQWPAGYPKEVTRDFIQKYFEVDNCTHVLVAVGQWPASYDQGHPLLLGAYHQDIRALFQRLQNELPHHVSIYARSIHSIPLRKRVSYCPPKDWRHPAVIYGYNLVIQKACQEYGIEYLDTSLVTTPMWDTSEDWNHLSAYVSDREAQAVLGDMLKRKEILGAPEQVVGHQQN